MSVGKPVNLLSLARAAGEGGALVPGTGLSVRRVGAPEPHHGSRAWLLVLAGTLILDLPHGDFRILERGDALHLPDGVPGTLQGLEGPALLLWRSDADAPPHG